MNILFERLSLQGHFRRVIDQYGEEQGWQIIRGAIERQLSFEESERLRKYINEQACTKDSLHDC